MSDDIMAMVRVVMVGIMYSLLITCKISVFSLN